MPQKEYMFVTYPMTGLDKHLMVCSLVDAFIFWCSGEGGKGGGTTCERFLMERPSYTGRTKFDCRGLE